MPGKQAKILNDDHLDEVLNFASVSRYPVRNRVIVLLSVKAGLRAGEIAKLTWAMVLDSGGGIGNSIELLHRAAKKQSGRRVPLHPELQRALAALHQRGHSAGAVIRSERGGPMRPAGIVLWFARAYRVLGLDGCSSHSGRRTFITRAARLVHKAGGSLRDVQLLAGHASIQTPKATSTATPTFSTGWWR
jgi:integrase/recombinase XerD